MVRDVHLEPISPDIPILSSFNSTVQCRFARLSESFADSSAVPNREVLTGLCVIASTVEQSASISRAVFFPLIEIIVAFHDIPEPDFQTSRVPVIFSLMQGCRNEMQMFYKTSVLVNNQPRFFKFLAVQAHDARSLARGAAPLPLSTSQLTEEVPWRIVRFLAVFRKKPEIKLREARDRRVGRQGQPEPRRRTELRAVLDRLRCGREWQSRSKGTHCC
jgi:hypothetical protein